MKALITAIAGVALLVPTTLVASEYQEGHARDRVDG